jgi:hypothetical protein
VRVTELLLKDKMPEIERIFTKGSEPSKTLHVRNRLENKKRVTNDNPQPLVFIGSGERI